MNSFFNNWSGRSPTWLAGQGPSADIVINTRALLIRNLAGFSFPIQATPAEMATILEELEAGLQKNPRLAEGYFLRLADLDHSQRQFLQELQLAASSLPRKPENRGLMVSEDLELSALVNGEDHLKLVAYRSGFDPVGAADAVGELEVQLESKFDFAYQEDLGYLTSWPGSVGTGLRLSALIHLPGLVLADEIDKILNALHQLKFSVRGLFGAGTSVRGGLFQISSLVTLGRDENEIINDFSFHLGKVLLHEKSARDQLYARDRLWLEDLVQRSHAVLRSAKLITSQETFDRLSQVRLGASLGILPDHSSGLLNTLLVGQQTGHLEQIAGESLSGSSRSQARASFLRSRLGQGE